MALPFLARRPDSGLGNIRSSPGDPSRNVDWVLFGLQAVLTIIGILWAWLPIWLGVLLFQAAGAAEEASASGDVATATRATDKLRLFFMIQGILMLISLVAVGLVFALGGFAMLAGLAGAAGSY